MTDIKLLKQGTKVRFRQFRSGLEYVGRIEADRFGQLYFVGEHCYENDLITQINEPLRFYNRFDSFSRFFSFEIL